MRKPKMPYNQPKPNWIDLLDQALGRPDSQHYKVLELAPQKSIQFIDISSTPYCYGKRFTSQ